MGKRRTRKLSKWEVVSLVLVVIAFIGWQGGSRLYMEHQATSAEEFKESQRQTFEPGETMVLDSAADEAEREGQEHAYGAGFSWHGTLEATVLDATLYPSYREAGIDEGSLILPPMGDAVGYLECNIRIRNVDATSTYEAGRPDRFLFFIFLGADMAYFSGTPAGADATSAYAFDLAQGQEAVYKVGYHVYGSESVDRLKVGATGKYTARIDVVDKTGEVS